MRVLLSVHFCESLTDEPSLSSLTQFLCLKNIRTFLVACGEVFGMKKSELFEAFDLFDVRDFGKVRRGRWVVHGVEARPLPASTLRSHPLRLIWISRTCFYALSQLCVQVMELSQNL